MLLARLFARRDSRSVSSRSVGLAHRPAAQRRRTHRPPHVELLEDRTLLSGWVVDAVGTIDDPSAVGLTTDSAGNVYVAGNFTGTAAFAPGVTLTSAGGDDVFVTKYTSAGALVWARRAGGTLADFGRRIAVDTSGNVYVTGNFAGTADFGSTNLTSAGQADVFVTKLDSAGNFVWAVRAGGTTSDFGLGIAVDPAGNVYTAGGFEGTADFDPGPGPYNLTSAGSRDIFVWKLDTNGSFLWANGVGSTGFDSAFGIALDGSANVYTTGSFIGAVDFDPGAGVQTLTSSGGRDTFVWKLDSSGNFGMARSMGAPEGDDAGKSIAIDGSGNIYTTGIFFGTADFDPGPGTATVSGYDCARGLTGHLFVSKLDASGNFVWARGWTDFDTGASGFAAGNAIAADSSGNVYVASAFSSRADFDPGPGVALLTGGGNTAFILKLDSGGNYLWARQGGGPAISAQANGVAVDPSANVYAVGAFSGNAAAVFDTGDADVSLTPSTPNGNDFFIWSIAQTGATSGSIQGRVFNDSNNNGVDDSTEVRLQGWTVYLDTNNNGLLDTGEPSTTSGSFGEYQFRHLAAGTYVVREIVQSGWTETLPSSGSFTVSLANGQFSVQSFGNFNPAQSPAGWLPTPSGCQDLQTGLIWAGDRTTGSQDSFWFAQDAVLGVVQDGFNDYGEATLKQMQAAYAHGITAQASMGGVWSTTLADATNGWEFSFTTGTATKTPTQGYYRGIVFVRGPGVVHADDGDPAYSDTATGWSTVTGQGMDGDYRIHASGSGADKATWSFGVQPAGQYKVLATWVAASSNGNKVPYKVFDGSTLLKSTTVNQRNAPSSKQGTKTIAWSDLGTVTTTGGVIKVELNNSNAGGNVVADMVRLVPIQSSAVAAVVVSRDRATASIDLVLDRYYSDDREDRDESASPLHLSGRSLAELLRTRRRR